MANLLSGTRVYGSLLVDAGIGSGNISVSNTTVSTSTTTGAITVAGGLGVAGNISIGSGIYLSGTQGSNNQILTSQGIGQPSIWESFDLSIHAPDSSYKKIVRVATTGAPITLSAGAPNTLDGITLAANDRILVKDQTTAAQNGIYYVSTLGTGANGTWSRAGDADIATDMDGATVAVGEGTVNGGRRYQTNWKATDTLGSTSMYWNRLVDVNSSSNIGLQTTAIGLDIATPSDLVTMATGAVTDLVVNSIGARALAAATASTYTRASSLYIAGAPTAGVNATITNSYALYVVGGNVVLGGNLNIGTTGAIGGALHTVRGNIIQTSSGGAVYINTSGNIIAAVANVGAGSVSTAPLATSNTTDLPNTSWVRQYAGNQSANVYTGANFVFSNTASFVPPGVTKIKVTVVGGGGAGGGGGAVVGVAGAGGGSGGIATVYLTNVAGAQFWANVGAGGTPTLGAVGGTGNVSTFTLAGTIYATATGGVGGAVGTAASTPYQGGTGGLGSTGNVLLNGSGGGSSWGTAVATTCVGGMGAPGLFGTGAGRGNVGATTGTVGVTGSGAGGGGATSTTAATTIGYLGGAGRIIIEW